jgi:hypothetical protein
LQAAVGDHGDLGQGATGQRQPGDGCIAQVLIAETGQGRQRLDCKRASNFGTDSILMQVGVGFVLFSRRNQHYGSGASVFSAFAEGFRF